MAAKCDRATPACSQCRKAGFPCEGYARQTIFVGAAIRRLSASRGGDTGARPWISHYTKQENRNAHITLPEPLVRTAREQLYMGYLWHTMTPKSHRSSIALSKLESSSWNRLIFESYVVEPSLRYVVMAWAMGCMAGRDQDSQMRIKSFKTYNTAVRHLSWTLNEKGAFKRDGLIIASGLMASFEVSGSIATFSSAFLSYFTNILVPNRFFLSRTMNRGFFPGMATATDSSECFSPGILRRSFPATRISYSSTAASTWYDVVKHLIRTFY